MASPDGRRNVAKCKTCEREFSAETLGQDRSCDDCRARLKLPAPAPPLRPHRPCSACNGERFIRALVRERSAATGAHSQEYVAPLAAAFRQKARYTLTGREYSEVSLSETVGFFEAYICCGCGYTELFTRDFQKIPISPDGPHFRTA